MRACGIGLGLVVSACLLAGPALSDPAPLAPPEGTSTKLNLYIRVRDLQTTEYCATEKLSAPSCAPGKFYEAKDACAAPYKVASVSCTLANFNADASLVANAIDVKQVTGSCVWSFDKLQPDNAPMATTTLLCIK